MYEDRPKNLNVTAWASWADYRIEESKTVELPAGGDLSCAFFFPADYSVGMANLGYHYIYRALRESGVAVERFFFSPIPYRSVERDTMLERFPIIFGSVSYEADIPKLAEWLRTAGIAPSRKTRRVEGQPFLGIGGAITYINPLSLSAIADFIVLGDGLPVIPHVVASLRKNASRETIQKTLAEHPSIFVPAVHLDTTQDGAALTVAKQADIARDYGHGNWVTPKTAFGNTLLVELQRGCIGGCRYCTLPSCFGPFRQRPFALVKDDIARIAATCSFDQIGLITPEASDYGQLDDLLGVMKALDKGVSFASLRLDGLTENAIRALVSKGRRSITVAPESGDDTLRASCGKRFTNDLIVETLQMAETLGIANVKLYFMIGLPGEGYEHLDATAELCARIKAKTRLRINAAVSPFVPKPGTAWRDVPFEEERDLKKKYAYLAKAFKKEARETLQPISVKEAKLEYALSWATADASRIITEEGDTKKLLASVDRLQTAKELQRLGLRI